jgi:hypothetical protein
MTLQILRLGRYGQKKVPITRQKYEAIKLAITAAFESRSQMSFEYLLHIVQHSGAIEKDGGSLWYLLMVKQYLQEKGILRAKFVGRPKIQMLWLNRRALKSQGATGDKEGL